MKRFHGSTIHNKAGNCAFVVRREVETARAVRAEFAEAEARRSAARGDAWTRPFRWIAGLILRRRPPEVERPKVPGPP